MHTSACPTDRSALNVRWQVSWLTGRRADPVFPAIEEMASDLSWTALAAYSCGGSYGFGP